MQLENGRLTVTATTLSRDANLYAIDAVGRAIRQAIRQAITRRQQQIDAIAESAVDTAMNSDRK